jgi:uncharacterized protein with GYD domain
LATHLLFLKLTPEGAKAIKGSQRRSKGVQEVIASLGGRVTSSFALFGKSDFMLVIEGLDDEGMMHVVLRASALGSVVTETVRALPLDRFYELVEAMDE